MPIEIRELHIKAVIGGEDNKDAQQAERSGSEIDKEELAAEVVDMVLEILKQKAER